MEEVWGEGIWMTVREETDLGGARGRGFVASSWDFLGPAHLIDPEVWRVHGRSYGQATITSR
jgi:hypothetical protein